MKIKKNKIWIISIIFISLLFTAFPYNFKEDTVDLQDKSNESNNNYFSNLRLSSPTAIRWWDSAYIYRMPINITNAHTGVLPKGYSVNVSVNTSNLISTGKLRFDGDDLRVVWYNSSSKTWLEIDRINETSFNNPDTQIWFKTQSSISGGSDDTNYYLYYGNENAGTPPTNRSKIYDYYDDFTQSDGPADGWNVISGTWSVINNEYRENSGVADRRSLLNSYSVENASIEVRIKNVGASFGVGILFRYSNSSNFYCAGIGFWDREIAYGEYTDDSWGIPVYDGVDESNLVSDQWYNLKVDAIGSQYKIYLDDQLRIEDTDTSHLNAGQIGFLTWTTVPSYYDDLKIRLLVATQPSLTLNSEELYGSWFNKDWQYRRKVTVTTGSVDIPSGYTVSLTFDHTDLVIKGKSQADGDDIRVVYWNGTIWNELDRMLDLDSSWDNESTKIWFKTQKPIQALSFDNNYYLYYGNGLASSPSVDPSNIYFFYDGFESGSLSGWDGNSTGSAGDSIEASTDQAYTGNYAAKCDMDNVSSPQAMVFEDFPDEASLFAHVHIYLDPTFSTSDRVTVLQFIDTSSGWKNLISVTIDDDMTLYMWNAVAWPLGEAYGYQEGNTISKGSWHTLDVQVHVSDTSGVAKLWLDGNLEIEATMVNLSSTPTDRFATGIYWASPNEFNTLFVDDIYLRIFVEPEPTLTMSIEEILRPSLNSFNYYKEITIDHTKVSGSADLIDFPLLISIFDSDLHDHAQSDGDDIAFYSGTEWLDHEIELFNHDFNLTHAQFVAWVRIPSLSTSIDTKIYMYYGNSTVSSLENPLGVWDDNYIGVWHLSEDPTGIVYDSTTNNNDGTSYGSMDSGDQILGKIDGSINFDGNDDNIGTEENNFLAGCSSLTMSAWIKPLSTQSDFCGIIEYDNTTDGSSFDAGMELRSTRVPRVNVWTTSGFEYVDSSVVLPTTQFTYFVFVYDGNLKIYLDGSFDSSTPHSGNIRNNRRYINIGRNTHDGRSFNGIIDEVHISNINRSASWITTEFNNQYGPYSFYSIGIEKSKLGRNTNYFTYYKEITIDHTKVAGSSDLYNYPLLLSLFDSDLHDHTQLDGDDIAFYDGIKWLDHEIELFNPDFNLTHAQLVAWVRIPSLSTSTDTKIYMYYGNSTVSSLENPAGVWDDSYIGVWHLSEDPTGTVYDSTIKNNDGTSYGSMNSADQISGKIDGSLEFDGNDDYIDCGNDNSLDITGDITIEFWVNGDSFTNDLDPDILTKGAYTQAYSTWINDDGAVYFQLNGNSLFSTTKLSLGNWHRVVCTRSGSNRTIFINGTNDISDSFSTAIETITETLTIARSPDNLNGTLDEIRLSKVARSHDWIATEYENQNDPTSFISIGMEESNLGVSVNFFKDYKVITIDHTKVSGSSNLINFPILISILDSELHNNTQPNGNDIAFWNGSNWLDHEIEFYNRDYNITHAKLVTWVRIPSLSPSTDTTIYMYYGNSTMGPQENPMGVWDANYAGVWHLSEDPSGSAPQILDSTLNNHNCTSYGSMTSGDQIAGQIDGSLDFDGSDDEARLPGELIGDRAAWTISAWIKMGADIADQRTIYSEGNSSESEYLLLYVDDTYSEVRFYSVTATGDYTQVIGSTNVENNQWHFVTMVQWSKTYRELYVDSLFDGNSTQDAKTLSFDSASIGTLNYKWGPADWFNGTIDEVCISNIARSPDWIATQYNNQYDPNNFYTIIFENDTQAPQITINYPISNYMFGRNAPSYDLTVLDANLDSIWYSLDGGVNSTPVSASGTIDQTMWNTRPNGTVSIRFYANDTAGNINYKDVIVRKDIFDPSIDNIDSPSSGAWFTSNPPSYSLSITESNLDEIWYTLDGGSTNYTGALSGTIDATAWSNAGQGSVTIIFYVNDSAGNWDFSSVGVNRDTIDPSIDSIDSPLPGSNHSAPPSYSLSITESNFDTVWYTLDGGVNNYTGASSGTIDSTAWSNAGQGSVTIIFYVNDSAGNWDSASVGISRDTIDPSIDSIDSPLPGSNHSAPPSYSLSITESNFDTVWYTLDGGVNNYTGASSGIIDSTAWSTAGQGSVTIIFYVNDSAGNWDSASVGISRDTIDPSIDSIDSPLPGSNHSAPPSYSLSITESNFDTVWYTLDGGVNNYTGASSGTIDSTAWSTAGQGSVTITFYVNDSAGNWDSASVGINRDTIDPTLVIIEPNNYDLFGTSPPNITININDSNLDESWYQLDNGTIITANYTWAGFIAQSVWDQVGNGTITIKFYANDTVGNLGIAEVIVYKDIFFPIITINSPNLDDVCNATAPNYIVSVSGSNLDTTWYTLDDGIVNYTFSGLTGTINQLAWNTLGEGTVAIKFYINNTLGVIGFDEITVIKDTIPPLIAINLPLNNTYCGIAPILNVLVTDANLDTIWYEVNIYNRILANNVNQQLDNSIWSGLSEGEFYIYIYANDSVGALSDPVILRLYKDTNPPSAPILLSFPQGEVSGNILFEWQAGSDPSGIIKYRLIIDTEPNPFSTPGFVFETNVTGNSYLYTGTLQPGTYYFSLYQIDGAGHQSSAATGSFSVAATSSPSQPSEFPLWIIFVIIGAVAGGVVGIVVLKKSKGKKEIGDQIPEKKPIVKPVSAAVPKVIEDLQQLDYDNLRDMSPDEINAREEKVIEYIKYLEDNNRYAKAAEFIGELILIEDILGNSQGVQLYRQKQIDLAVKGLEYLKEQYEIESKNAAVSGDYSKALELYKESKLISDNLKGYLKQQESFETSETTILESEEPYSTELETVEPQSIVWDMEFVYSCINDLLTKFFDDIGIKYYSTPQIYEHIPSMIHGLILTDDKLQIADIEPSIRDKVKSIQIIYSEDMSNENITNLCQTFQNPYAVLIIVGIKWPENIKAQTIDLPPIIGIEYEKTMKIMHYELFAAIIGLKDAYKSAFTEIIDLYNKSEFEFLQNIHESSEVIIHGTDELKYDLKEKGLISDNLHDYFGI